MADRRSLMTRGLQAVAQIATPTQPPAGSKIGWTPGTAPDRTQPVQSQPSASLGGGENKSAITTYFTKPYQGGSTPILYNGDRQWAKVILTLETAGPVVVGNAAQITPVLSGKGQLLQTNTPMAFTIAKGTRLYVASTSVNRIKVVIEPLPWLEQIAALVTNVVGAVRR